MVNARTNQSLSVAEATSYPGGKNLKIDLMTKVDPIRIEWISITTAQLDRFVDSLEGKGWSHKVKYKSGTRRYTPSIELNSISFHNVSSNSDSIFLFVYKIALTDKRTGKVLYQLDSIRGNAKDSVLMTFERKGYDFGSILIQKKTDIISVFVQSIELFDPWKERDYPGLGPALGKSYYF